jgi:hypothetical protein
LSSLHEDRLFKSQKKLVELLLANNELTTLDISVLNPLVSINSLVLLGNPFNCNCQLRLTMIWCGNRGLDTDATCEYSSMYRGYSWSVTNSSGICSVIEKINKVNISEYVPTIERDVGETVADEWQSGTSIAGKIIYACVAVLVLFVIVFIVASLWGRFKHPTGLQDAGDSIKHDTNLNEDYYYTDIELSQNVIPVPFPPKISKNMSTDELISKSQGQNTYESQVYEYVECDLGEPNTVTASEQCSNSGKFSKRYVLQREGTSHSAGQLATDHMHRNTLYTQE